MVAPTTMDAATQTWTSERDTMIVVMHVLTGISYFIIPLCVHRIARAQDGVFLANVRLSVENRDYFIWFANMMTVLDILFVSSCGLGHLVRALGMTASFMWGSGDWWPCAAR